MFKNISLKVKIIIFAVLCAVGISIIVKTAMENNKQQNQLKAQLESEVLVAQKNKEIKEEENIKIEAEKLEIQEKNKIKEINEEKYNKGFQLYSIDGKYTETIKLMEEIIAQDESFYKAYNLKGIALCYLGATRGDGGKFEDGIASINKALQIKSDYGYAAFSMAEAYALYAHYDKAIEWYNKAIEIEPEYSWSYYGLAKTYVRKNDNANALKYLKQAIDRNPLVKNNVVSDNDFNNIKNSGEYKSMVGN
jgi:tetratricopeptide (TPR) repeat protein